MKDKEMDELKQIQKDVKKLKEDKKVLDGLNDLHMKIEKERKSNAVVEARIIRISDNNYKIRVFNIGNISAFQVDYDIPAKYNIVLCKQVTPFEELKPGASFDEHVLIHMGSEPKYEVITEWDDENGEHYTRKDIRTY